MTSPNTNCHHPWGPNSAASCLASPTPRSSSRSLLDSHTPPCLYAGASDTITCVSESSCLILASSPPVHCGASPCASCLFTVPSTWGFTSTPRTSPGSLGSLQPTSAELQTHRTSRPHLLHSRPPGTSNPTCSQLTHLPTCSPPGFPTLANGQGFFYLGKQRTWLLGGGEEREGKEW